MQNNNAINFFADLHTNRLEQECLGNNPQVNLFNAQIREGLGEDEADEDEHDPMLIHSLFGESDEPTEEEINTDLRARELEGTMFRPLLPEEITATPPPRRQRITSGVRISQNRVVWLNTDLITERLSAEYERSQLRNLLDAPSTRKVEVRQPRPNPVFNPRAPKGVPSHMADVAASNAAMRSKKGRGFNR